jgi:hypothetical protein
MSSTHQDAGSDLDAALEAHDAALASLDARVTALEQGSSMPGPEPGGGTLIGVNAENKASVIASFKSRFPGTQIWRLFWSGVPSGTIIPEAITPEIKGLHVSFKGEPSAVLGGSNDSKYRTFLGSLPDHIPVWCTWYHEPENNDFSPSSWRDAWKHVYALDEGHKRLWTPVYMGWTVDDASGRNWRDWYPGDQYVDCMSYDLDGVKPSGGKYPNYDNEMSNIHDIADETGKPWSVGEFNSHRDPGDTDGTDRAAWIEHYGMRFINEGAVNACFFDSAAHPGSSLEFPVEYAAWNGLPRG